MIDVRCALCEEPVTDHRRHIAERLHDQFVVRLPNGTDLHLGDMNASIEVNAREQQAFDERLKAAAVREDVEHAENEEELAANLAALPRYEEDISRAESELKVAARRLAEVEREIPVMEGDYAAAQRGSQRATAKARRDIKGRPDAKWPYPPDRNPGVPRKDLLDIGVLMTPEVEQAEAARTDVCRRLFALREEREQLRREQIHWAEMLPWSHASLARQTEHISALRRGVSRGLAAKRDRILNPPRRTWTVAGLALRRAQDSAWLKQLGIAFSNTWE